MGPLAGLVDYVLLPKEISAFEASYLRRMNRIGLAFFALHVPVMVLIAWANRTNPLFAFALSAAVVVGPAVAYSTLSNPRAVSVTYGVAAMFMGGVLVHFGQGPVQMEMHFYFFALIAMLAVFGNPLVIVAAAVTVALHHLVLWFVIPRSVFNYDAPVWVVAVHAAFVVLESAAGCFIARSFFDNVIGLEKIVRARTAELDRRNHDMRLVLDNVAQGFVTIDRAGKPSAERSRTVDQWLGTANAGETLFDMFERRAPDFAATSRCGWDEVIANVLPLALTLEQMPKALVVDDAEYQVAYVPIGGADVPARFLVVVTDVTAEIRRERAERDRREAMLLFERLLSDRTAVNDFLDEGSALVSAVLEGRTGGSAGLKRMLHTLKGNSAIFGLDSLSTLCHELETRVAEEGQPPQAAQLTYLRERWNGIVSDVDRMTGARRRILELDEKQHVTLEQMVRARAPHGDLLQAVHALKLEPSSRRLEHFAEQARRIAARLEKSVDVVVAGDGLRIDPNHWGPFWSAFIHAVRNAVDHGLEAPEARVRAGKPERGHLALRTYLRAGQFVVEISDDGPGIDWLRVALKAKELGLPAGTAAELQGALFHGGVSTAARVTDISGRGIGMGAVLAATKSLGGHLEIETKAGSGTSLRMVFPAGAMAPELDTAQTRTAAA